MKLLATCAFLVLASSTGMVSADSLDDAYNACRAHSTRALHPSQPQFDAGAPAHCDTTIQAWHQRAAPPDNEPTDPERKRVYDLMQKLSEPLAR